MTASFGVAELGRGESGASLLRRADHALYAAKEGERNRVTADRSAAPPDTKRRDAPLQQPAHPA